MNRTNPRADAYFDKVEKWREEQLALRSVLLETPLSEDYKWRSPCYTFDDSNIVTVWGLKDHCALGFFKGALLKDAKGILVAPGDNSRSMRKMAFTSLAEIAGMGAVIKDYVDEAIEVEKAGLKVDFRNDGLEYPAELKEKLEEAPEVKAAFEALTPGRRRGYVLHFSQPKQAKTRISRIERLVPRILEKKGLHDR